MRYQITTSAPQLEAGTKFSIYTRITNPYDVPVTIKSVTTLLPVEFRDIALLERANRKHKILELISSVQRDQAEPEGRLSNLFQKRAASEVSPRLSTEPLNAVPESDILADADALSLQTLIRTANDKQRAKNEVVRKLKRALEDVNKMSPTEVNLQPGNSVIQVFTLKTNRAIFFQPNVYQSSVRIEYEIDSAKNIDVADYQLNVRAPLKAILCGALLGSVFGFLLKDLTGQQNIVKLFAVATAQGVTEYLLSLLTAGLISVVVVVGFARKKDAQPILSVEDFWGGVFVGFLAGYTGKAMLEKPGITPNPLPTGALVPSPTPTAVVK